MWTPPPGDSNALSVTETLEFTVSESACCVLCVCVLCVRVYVHGLFL